MSGASKEPSNPRRKRWRRRGWLFVLAFLALVILGGWMVVELWMIPFASKLAEEELAKHGYHVTYQDPDLTLWNAKLTIKNLTLHRTSQKAEPLIFVSDLGVDIDLRSLIWNRTLSGRCSIRRGNVIVFGKNRQPDFRKLAVDIEFDPDGARISRFTGESNLGYRLNLVGAISWSSPTGHPEALPGAPTDAEPPSEEEQPVEQYPEFPGDLSRLEELANLFFCEPQGDELVSLELDLNWDQTRPIAKPSEGADENDPTVTLDGRILGRDVLWKKFPLEQLEASFRLGDWEVAIPEMKFTALTGEAVASGRLDLESNQFLVDHVRSSVNPIAVISRLAPKLAAPLEQIEFDENPLISGEQVIVDFRDQRASKFTLNVEAPQGIRVRESPADAATIEFESIRGTLEYGDGDSEQLLFRDFSAIVNDLEIHGKVAIANFLFPNHRRAAPKVDAQAGIARPGPSDKPATKGESPPGAAMPLVGILSNLMQVKSEREPPPQLEVNIVSDWSAGQQGHPTIEIGGQFSGSDFSWHGREIESARVEFGLEDQLLELSKIEIIGLAGELQASASYDIDERIVAIPKLTSTADISHLRKKLGLSLPGVLNSITFQAPPHLTVDDFELQLGETPVGQGEIEFVAEHGFEISGEGETLQIRSFDLAISWDAPHLLTVERANGSIEDLEFDFDGSLHWRSRVLGAGENGGEGDEKTHGPEKSNAGTAEKPVPQEGNGINPSFLAALSRNLSFTPTAEPVHLEGHFEWHQPQIDPAPTSHESVPTWMEQLTLDATISGENFDWRGFSVDNAESKIEIAQGSVQFVPFKIDTSDGSVELQGAYVISERKLRIEELRSTADPFLALERIGFPLEALDASIDFLDTPVLTGRDLQLDLDHLNTISGTLELDDQVGLALNLPGGRRLVLEDFRGPLSFGDGEFRSDKISARILGGEAQAKFRISPFEKVPSYASTVNIKDISLTSMGAWFDPDSGFDEAGTFDFSFEGNGAGTLESLTGSGRAAIGAEGGSAHHFPVLSGLVGFIDSGLDKEWDFDLPFGVSDGKIATTAGKLSGHSISVHLSGSVDWVNDHVDFIAGVNLNGLIGVVTKVATPLREDFVEIIGQGTLEDVEWGTKNHFESGKPRHHPWKPRFRKLR